MGHGIIIKPLRRAFIEVSLLVFITGTVIFMGCSNPLNQYEEEKVAPDSVAPNPGGEGVISVTQASYSFIEIHWTKASDNSTDEAGMEYKVVYSKNDNVASVEEAESNGITSIDWTNSTTSATLSGLDSGESYFFNVIVRDGNKNKAVYASHSVSTLAEGTPTPGDSGNLSVTQVTDTTVDLSWAAASDTVNTHAELKYRVVYSSSDDISTVTDALENGNIGKDWTIGITDAQVNVPTDGDTHYFNVIVEDEEGKRAVYTITFVDKTEPVPGGNGNLEITNVGQTSLTLQWDAASDDITEATSLKYKVVYSSSDNIDSLPEAEDNNEYTGSTWSTNLSMVNISSLASGTMYYFNVIVKDENENKTVYSSASTTTIIVDKTGPVPGGDGNLDITDVGLTSVALQWEVASDDISETASLEYKVVYSSSDNIGSLPEAEDNNEYAGSTWSTNLSSVNISSLASGTTYYFNVIVRDANENKDVYNSTSATTVDPNWFITTWKTDNGGVSEGNQIKLPLDDSGTYDFIVYWGDGTQDTITAHDQAEITHTYPEEGTYDVIIDGTIEGFGFKVQPFMQPATEDTYKFIDVKQWGEVRLHNSGAQFANCSNLVGFSATDTPVLTYVTNMSKMFYTFSDTSFNGDISDWDVSNVTNMSNMFYNASSFDADISNWDISNVTNMFQMFQGASSFSADLSTWDVSKVTTMGYMFKNASSFNSDLSLWDVSSVTNMKEMFYGASSFNSDLNTWNMSIVTDMERMFFNASSFDSDLSSWQFPKVTSLDQMFVNATSFNGDISGWDVSGITSMLSVFSGASSFNGDIVSWDVSNVTNMSGMFSGAGSFNSDLNTWDVSNVVTMSSMFRGAESFNGDISTWNVSSVSTMIDMFNAATSFNGDISAWDVTSVYSMEGMFTDATNFNRDLSSWDVSGVERMNDMFMGATSFNGDISGWNLYSIEYMAHMFEDASSFNVDIGSWDVSSLTYSNALLYMFYNASSFNQDLSGWCVSDIDSEPLRFHAGSALTEDNLPVWGTCP